MIQSKNIANSGVNREQGESILKRFLDNDNYGVLAVKGNWGIGKTYLVKNFLSKYKNKSHFYASVFGISSIEQLKARILSNSYTNLDNQKLQTKKEPFINKLKKGIYNISEGINRNYGRLEKTPRLDVGLSGQFSIPVVGSLISVAGDLGLNLIFNLQVRKKLYALMT